MRALWDRTAANGLEREWLNAQELREREPNITGLGGIFCSVERDRQLP
ncbi:L-2-hydroxyglutarate oxidase [Citrobacter freundii]|uniref:L-2-hydroxyglutarate oxidase n=1 Tax=Citrobacter freundii TaxID=546 RepID=A0A7G2ITA3_CITFR|nr:L-2-hydroxyglutarate oxidase [Citrobacter freundii]